MLLDKNHYSPEQNIEFLLERPIGWSSACLDSTINYYLSHGSDHIDTNTQENFKVEEDNT